MSSLSHKSICKAGIYKENDHIAVCYYVMLIVWFNILALYIEGKDKWTSSEIGKSVQQIAPQTSLLSIFSTLTLKPDHFGVSSKETSFS